MLTIFLLGRHGHQIFDSPGACDTTQSQGGPAERYQGTHRIRRAYSQSTCALTGSVLLRSPSDSAKRRARRGFTTLISS